MITTSSYIKDKVYLLNWIMTIMVVMIHANPIGYYGLDEESFPLIKIVSRIAEIAVPMFFFISAFLFYRDCDSNSIKSKIKRRIHSLVIPYLLWNTIFVSIFFVLLNIPFFNGYFNMGSSALDTPYKIIDAIINSRLTPLWFVQFLIFFTFLSPIILLSLKRKYIEYIIILCLIFLSLGTEFNWLPYKPTYPHLNIFRWAPCYYIGAMYGHYIKSLTNSNETPQPKSRRYCGVLYLIGLTALCILAIIDPNKMPYYRLFAPLLLWLLVVSLTNRVNKRRHYYNYTFFIYCSHYFLINVIMKIATRIINPSTTNIYLLYILIPPFIITILSLIAKLTYNSKIYKLLSGGR